MAELNNNGAEGVLTPVEQAAIVLLSIGEEPAAAVLRCLERDELIELTQVMSRMSGIKVDSVKYAVQNFFDDYREQSGLHGASRTYLKRSLDLALGSDIANSVLNTIYGDAIRPMMARLQYASPKWLAEFISHEHVQMQAVFIAFLPPALAGQIIEGLPESGRDLVLLNLARLDEIDRDLLKELEDLVTRCLSALDTQSASVEGVRQVAEI
ncbi:MAG: fliG, partial [Massilia sp.]|nr:fliG [Massilia sp.]